MRLFREYPSTLTCPPGHACFCPIWSGPCPVGPQEGGCHILLWGESGCQVIPTPRPYRKLTWDPATCHHWALAFSGERAAYRLDDRFQECGRISLAHGAGTLPIYDLWLDPVSPRLLTVSGAQIQPFNLNGDALPPLLTPPMGTAYQAVCTYGQALFVAYHRDGMLQIASYTPSGVFLEGAVLGGARLVRGMEMAEREGHLFLLLTVATHGTLPWIIEVSLEEEGLL